MGSFQISGIYSKYPKETVLFFVYTSTARQGNFAFHITHIFFSHTQLIGFTATCESSKSSNEALHYCTDIKII